MLGINVMNVEAYADDIVLMAPSANALQKILNRTGNLIAECDLVVNIKKTEVMVFKRKAANLDTGLNVTCIMGQLILLNLSNTWDAFYLQISMILMI